MEPTYAAEGDYDSGNVQLGETGSGETPFIPVPDADPDLTIDGQLSPNPALSPAG